MSDRSSWFETRICNSVVNGLDFSVCFEAIALNGVAFFVALVALLLCCIAAQRPVASDTILPDDDDVEDEAAGRVAEVKYEWSAVGTLYCACAAIVYAAPWIAVGVETGFQPSRTGLDQLIAAIFQSLTGVLVCSATKSAIFERASLQVQRSGRIPPAPIVVAWIIALISLAIQIHTVALGVAVGIKTPSLPELGTVFLDFIKSPKLVGLVVQEAAVLVALLLIALPKCGGCCGGATALALSRLQIVPAPPRGDAERKESPELRVRVATWASVLTFSWIGELLLIGYRRALTVADLYSLHPSDAYARTLERVEARWAAAHSALTEWRRSGPHAARCALLRCGKTKTATEPLLLWNVMASSFGAPYIVAGALKLVYDTLKFVSPVILRAMIEFLLPESSAPLYMGFVYVGCLALANGCMTLVLHQYFHGCYRTGMRLKVAVNAMVFNKALVVKVGGEESVRVVAGDAAEAVDETASAPEVESKGSAAEGSAAELMSGGAAQPKKTEGGVDEAAAESVARDEAKEKAGASGTGRITNLMSVDAQKLQDLMTYLHMIWSGPYQIVGSIALLWRELGPSVIVGVVVMILLIPFSITVGVCISKIQTKLMKVKDERQKDTNEMLAGMKIVKQYAWEPGFAARIAATRRKELCHLFAYSMVNALSNLTWSLSPILVCLLTFATYIGLGNTLTASKAFTSMALFSILRFPVVMFPRMIANLMEALVSVRRLQNFLMEREVVSSSSTDAILADAPSGDSAATRGTIEVDSATFYWSRPSSDDYAADADAAASPRPPAASSAAIGLREPLLAASPVDASAALAEGVVAGWEDAPLLLRDVSFSAPRGKLTVIAGKTGSGKSGLLSALLGDLPAAQGTVAMRGSVAYCAQVPWIQHASLRENVLFESSFDAQRYADVIAACALADDILLLPNGDATEIGEKGVNLSGGQKQRVALARALYNDADIYLLDDCLSAVDPEVAQHLFNQLVLGELVAKGKTTVLVTHNTRALESADFALFLGEKGVEFAGTPPFPSHLMHGAAARVREAPAQAEDAAAAAGAASPTAASPTPSTRGAAASASTASSPASSPRGGGAAITATKKKESSVPTLTASESVAKGAVSMGVYWLYAQATGGIVVGVLVLAGLVGYNICQVAANRFLAFWSDASHVGSANIMGSLEIYAALLFGAVLCSTLALAVSSCGSIRAASQLHARILRGIVRAPMSFFHATPIGRLQNRFSKDLYTIDEKLIISVYSYLSCMVNVAATLGVIAYVTPYFIVVLLPMCTMYLAIQRFYIPSSRELKRLDSILRSPMFSHFAETLDGADTIRAFSVPVAGATGEEAHVQAASQRVAATDMFRAKNERCVDGNSRAYYLSVASNRWLAIRLETLGTITICSSALFAVFMRGNIIAGLGGMAISYALTVTQTLNWMVRMSSETETNVVSVERIVEYANTAPEAQWVLASDARLPGGERGGWEHSGALRLEQLSMRYRPGLPLVLSEISIDVPAGSSVGIVGRTGAGKSSLFAALLRLVEAERRPVGARAAITIDGVDVSQIGLHTLRRAISIIPQDPVLFNGSLRFNLDPLRTHEDGELWVVLDKAGLGDHARSLPGRLDHKVAEGGKNFSQGEKQLVCLARALLRSSKLLLLDEATSSVDFETDSQIQATIRAEFADATVLTIAHRVDTICDCDRILVLAEGKVAEYGSPAALIAKGGEYAKLIKAHEEGFDHVANAMLG